jgi:type I restriction enzyme S subunit
LNVYLSVPLSQLLTRSTESVELQPDRRYKQVTVRLWGQGVVERNEVGGSEIAGTRRFVVRPGQFILSRIDARNGALGIVPAALDGAVVSNDFPSFLVNETRLLPAYLGWLTRTSDFVDLCRAASAGTTNRVRLDESRFLDMEIPLPPLAEQRRIVARIEALAAQINEARGLRREAVAETEALIASESDRLIGKIADQHGTTPFNSFSPHVTSGPRNWGAKYSDHGIRFYRAQDIGPNGKILGSVDEIT